MNFSVKTIVTLIHWWVVPIPVCWHCYIDEWAYVGIAIMVSDPYMLGLFHCWVFLDVGIATLRSYTLVLLLLYWWVIPTLWDCYTGEWSYMLGLLFWWVVPTCWYCYTGEWSLYVGNATLVSGSYILALLQYIGEWAYVGIAILVRSFILVLPFW